MYWDAGSKQFRSVAPDAAHAAWSADNDSLKAAAAERLGLGRGIGGGSKWMALSLLTRKVEKDKQKQIDAGLHPTTGRRMSHPTLTARDEHNASRVTVNGHRTTAKHAARLTDGDSTETFAPRRRTTGALHPELVRIRAERKAAYQAADTREGAKKDGFVYGVVHARAPGFIKIGYGRDPSQRVTAAQTWVLPDDRRAGGYELIAEEFFEDAYATEQRIHKLLGARRVEDSEWFECSVDWFCRNLINLSHRCVND